jgi:Protein of unknown function (DUF1501)
VSTRRGFLTDLGTGLAGVALSAIAARDGVSHAATPADGMIVPDGRPNFAPRAKNVIWLFMIGGASHLESFDPKPALNKYAGKTIAETPYAATLGSKLTNNVRIFVPNDANGHIRQTLYPLQVGYRKRGESGIEISDWWPGVASCADDLAVIRSMWTTDNNHGAQLQFHTGRHILEGQFPTIGSWVHYGLGSLNDDLPAFVVLGTPIADCCGGLGGHGASYLGPDHDGVQFSVDPNDPLPFATPPRGMYREEQVEEFALLRRLNGMTAAKHPDDAALRARMKSYELAFRMQAAVPEVLNYGQESKISRDLYGLDHDVTRPFGQMCLSARRMVERGVRFVQIFHGSNGGAGGWDAHAGLRQNHASQCAQVDRPIAGLLADLKQRGLLDETIVVWATEFGRTPGAQSGTGRDHHPFGFSVWMAGGGIKGGVAHGATDELGFHAVENRHYITDVHATLLHQLGLDPHRLEVPGHKRLEIDYGNPIREIIG